MKLDYEIAAAFLDLERAAAGPALVRDGAHEVDCLAVECLSRAICHSHGLYVREKYQESTVSEL